MRASAFAGLVLPALLLAGGGPPGLPTGAIAVSDLRCEYRKDPLGIDETQPRLGWVLTATARNQEQSAYQVLVATNPAALARNEGDLWNSGKVVSSASVHVVYAGKPLASRTSCHWKVRVWDGRGRVSAWSAPARWEMGLLAPSDWTATWINDGKRNPEADVDFYRDDPAPLFRREFTVPAPVARARLYVAGLGYDEAFINGSRVGDQVLDPGWTMYGKQVLYSTHDVTALVRQGRNCLAATLGNGWYNPLPLRMWGNLNLRDHLVVGRPRLVAQLEVETTDGSRVTVASDPAWRVADGPLLFNSVYLGEVYDARREIDGWDQPGFDDRGWRPAAPATEPVGALRAQRQPPIRADGRIRPVSVSEPAKGVFVFDMGRNFAGWATLRLTAPRGAKVVLRYGELLNADGMLNPLTSVAGQVKGRRAGKDGVARQIGGDGAPDVAWQSDSYVARGRGVETFTPRFAFHGFRFVELSGYSGRPTLDAISGVPLHADVEDAGSFESSNPLLNRIQDATRRTFKSNLFSVQSDCPHREKFGYGGDIVATSDAFMLNFDMAAFYAKAVGDWADSARPGGMLTDTAPFVGIQYCGVGWAMVHPVLQAGLYQYYGDRALIERQYETSRRWLDLVAASNPAHVVRDGLGDHESLVESPVELLATPEFFFSARLVAQLAAVLDRTDEAAHYSALADDVRHAFRDRRRATILEPGASRTQSTEAFALQLGLLDEEERRASVRWLLDDIRKNGKGHLSTGIFGTKFALEALSAAGHAQEVFDLVREETFPGWGYMLANGATTLWEHWAMSEDTYSHNHPMFGSVSEWLFRWLAGIQADPHAVGFDRILLRPQPVDGLDWVRASYRSVRGVVAVAWRRTAGHVEWLVTVPVNAEATLEVPADRLEDVEEGWSRVVPAVRAEGVRRARMEAGTRAAFVIGSGRYRFVSRVPGR